MTDTKSHNKEAKKLADELEKSRERQALGEARIAELESQRGALAYDALSKPKAKQQLESLEAELSEERRQVERAGLIEAEASRREAERQERRRQEHEQERQQRYDEMADEKRQIEAGLDETLDGLISECGRLLEIDQEQMFVASELGIRPAYPLPHLLGDHLKKRLSRLIPEAGAWVSRLPRTYLQQPLLESDLHAKPLRQQRAENQAQTEEATRRAGLDRENRKQRERWEKFDYRRRELEARFGLPNNEPTTSSINDTGLTEDQNQGIRRRVDATLEHEFPELLAAEKERRLEVERQQIRNTLLSSGEDYESLAPERKREVDAAVEEWLLDGGATL